MNIPIIISGNTYGIILSILLMIFYNEANAAANLIMFRMLLQI